jgi:hypothetical protein
MYRYVYWHRDVRNITAIIKKAILLGLREQVIAPKNLYYLDDQEFFSLMSSYEFPPFKIVRTAGRGQRYIPVRSVPFSPKMPFHRELENLDRRLEFEAQIARKLGHQFGAEVGEEQVVVDVPEPISFEMDLAIVNRVDSNPSHQGDGSEADAGDGYTPYEDSRGVFGADVVRGFTRSLRTIRLLVSPAEGLFNAAQELDLHPLD